MMMKPRLPVPGYAPDTVHEEAFPQAAGLGINYANRVIKRTLWSHQ